MSIRVNPLYNDRLKGCYIFHLSILILQVKQLKFATLDRCKLKTQSVQLVKAANSGKNDGSQNELKNTCHRKASTESLTLANKVNLKRFTN